MATTPWYTSQDLINAVKRKIAIPISQKTFSEEDILAFCNEEMMISQVPDILQYHEEYLVIGQDIPLVNNKTRYAIPDRAIGLKLRDVFYKDTNGNLFEMARVAAEDQAFFQRETGTNNIMQKYFLEGNDLVLSPVNVSSVSGYLHVTYYLRPNQLVLNDRAAISNSFVKQITIDNTSLIAGNTVSIGDLTFTAVAGAPSALEFQIGANSIVTATNLVAAINLDGTYSANNGTPSTAVANITYLSLDTEFNTNNTTSFNISTQEGITFNEIPDNITNGDIIDFLQTKPGHKTLEMSVKLGSNSISGLTIFFAQDIIPNEFIPGDYICLENECIIPQIPTDLHNGLAERVCSRIMAAQGDTQGLQMVNSKLDEIRLKEGTLLDTRVGGSVQKITQRRGLIGWGRIGIRKNKL